jgi:hypothetical protein
MAKPEGRFEAVSDVMAKPEGLKPSGGNIAIKHCATNASPIP